MSRFDTDFAASGLPQLLFQFGQSVIYLPVNLPEVSLTAIVESEQREIVTPNGIRTVKRTHKVTIGGDPDSDEGGVTSPNEVATMRINNTEWPIESVSQTAGGWILMLVRHELEEQARPGYRGGFE